MRVTVDEAREYFQHASQQKAALITPDALPEQNVLYYAKDGVCVCFHDAHWRGVIMAHYGVKPEVWGRTVEPAKAILRAFWDEYKPDAIIGWTDAANKLAISFAQRVGFIEYGRLKLPSGTVIMQEWKPWD